MASVFISHHAEPVWFWPSVILLVLNSESHGFTSARSSMELSWDGVISPNARNPEFHPSLCSQETRHFVFVRIPSVILYLLFNMGTIGTNKRKSFLWLMEIFMVGVWVYLTQQRISVRWREYHLQFDRLTTRSTTFRKIILPIKGELITPLNRWWHFFFEKICLLNS